MPAITPGPFRQEDLFEKHGVDEKQFQEAGLTWEELMTIANDHVSRAEDYQDALDAVLKRLTRIPGVHSTRGRIKDPVHLMAKCVRKRPKYPDLCLENYRTHITDLIGVRALHLYKLDWVSIHERLQSGWKHVQDAKAYIRKGDDTAIYAANNCKTEEHPKNYRSVHYTVEVQVTDLSAVVEIQVRTLFEEAWSEIDHQVRYPHDKVDLALGEFLNLFNRIAGASDEMGSYVGTLARRVRELKQEVADAARRHDELFKSLREQINLTKLTEEDKKKLLRETEHLKTQLREANRAETVGKVIGGIGSVLFSSLFPFPKFEIDHQVPTNQQGGSTGDVKPGIVVSPVPPPETSAKAGAPPLKKPPRTPRKT